MLFSERQGLKVTAASIQVEGMSPELRNGLWDVFYLTVLEKEHTSSHGGRQVAYSNLRDSYNRLWHNLFKKPVDTIPDYCYQVHEQLRTYFMGCEWLDAYDFLDFCARNIPDQLQQGYASFSNRVLERELSAYRFIDGQLAPISAQAELDSIERALRNTEPYSGARAHLEQALSLMSDRKAPDYRNSIKESISAVESIAQVLTGDSSASLGAALSKLEAKGRMHPALKSSLSKLYGYTSDGDGIRHAMLEEPTLTFADAKFMLVACTAFVNYLIDKAR